MLTYFQTIQRHFKSPSSSEYTYRTAFENFLQQIFKNDRIQEIKHEASTGDQNKPDFIILENKVPNLYIECKDVPVNLDKIEKSDQAARYFGYENLIITNYIEFRLYRHGRPYCSPIHLGKIDAKNRTITPNPAALESLKKVILGFFASHKEAITSGQHLAEIMGGKALRIRENIAQSMQKEDGATATEMQKIMEYLREHLIADLSAQDFADMYAQTLVYGLFAARYNDKTLEDFSRAEARELVPATNPLLRDFFAHIATDRFPASLALLVDELCEVFRHADIPKLLADFYQKEKDNKDPIIHFYEDFLHEYDRKKKMKMGVFYTPEPVVDFIVRGVDDLLKTELGIANGLADAEKKTVNIRQKLNEEKEKVVQKDLHRVQVLDIATGTGTFLDKVVQHIAKGFKGQEGMLGHYIHEHLIPRLHGFELMMASYTIAHLKLGITLQNLGLANAKQRLGVYLTNTLEKAKKTVMQASLFGVTETIAKESEQAGKIKNDLPILCVIGNPPYSGESMNGFYTENDVYKVEPGGKEKLKERNSKWINDDYVKFMRFAESLIEKNSSGGIVGMITAHGYIDNPTFRGMRWHLEQTFDKIFVLDLHGNSRKKETAPNGGKDENVFDIMTGVSVFFGVKKPAEKGARKKPAEVFVADAWGLRAQKFAQLDAAKSLGDIKLKKLPAASEIWKPEPRGKKEYEKGFSVAELFPENSVGVVTARDEFTIHQSKEKVSETIESFLNLEDETARETFQLGKDVRDWKVAYAKKDLKEYYPEKGEFAQISYRPFDNRWTFYTGKSKGFHCYPRPKIMQHFLRGENVGLVFCKQVKAGDFHHVGISNSIIESSLVSNKTGEINSIAPLYLYHEDGMTNGYDKQPNLCPKIWQQINQIAGPTTPENVLDFCYAVLHSPAYRQKYAPFLKTNFPRVPLPTSKQQFWRLAALGEKLRQLHLLQSPDCDQLMTTFPKSGSNEVEKITFDGQNVWINAEQYFGGVPRGAWEFFIGCYQPAQKWLKDRKGQHLTSDELFHWQKIITVLVATENIMGEIDSGF